MKLRVATVLLSSACAFAASCVDSTDSPQTAARHVFQTSQAYTGNLIAAAGDPSLDGPAAADLLCNRAAASAGLGGTWTAWISVGTGADIGLDPQHPGYDVHGFDHASYTIAAIDRLAGDGPWVDTSGGAVVFASRAALLAGDQGAAFTNEAGAPAPYGQFVWTGTRNTGEPTSNDCDGWSTERFDIGDGAAGSDDRGTAGTERDVTVENQTDARVEVWTDDPDAAFQDDPTCTECPDVNEPLPADADASGFGTLHCADQLALYCFEN